MKAKPRVVQDALGRKDLPTLRRCGRKGGLARAKKMRQIRERNEILTELAELKKQEHEQEEFQRSREANEHICPIT